MSGTDYLWKAINLPLDLDNCRSGGWVMHTSAQIHTERSPLLTPSVRLFLNPYLPPPSATSALAKCLLRLQCLKSVEDNAVVSPHVCVCVRLTWRVPAGIWLQFQKYRKTSNTLGEEGGKKETVVNSKKSH